MQVWLFDIDGTLIKTNGVGQHSMCRALHSAFGTEPHCRGISFAGRTDRAITSDIFELHGLPDSNDNRTLFRSHYLDHLAANLENCIGQVLPGVHRLLNFLKSQANVKLGLLTGNIEKAALMKLERFGIDHFFQFGGFGDVHAERDSVAASAYDSACANLGKAIARHQVWVVGDTPSDIQCGQSIGAKTIAVATGSYPGNALQAEKPDHLYRSLDELDETTLW